MEPKTQDLWLSQFVLIAGTPVGYLYELAETADFKANSIDTAWLDRLITEKTVSQKVTSAQRQCRNLAVRPRCAADF